MTNIEKKKALQKLRKASTRLEESYYLTLEDIGDLKNNYIDYMTTAPVNVDEELRRLPDANYELCSALLTMLLREDYFSNGSFERRYDRGQVTSILDKMIKLL